MEAPEKIWINPSMDLPKLNGIIDKDSIQYIRKDALVKYLYEEKGYPITLNGELLHWDELNKHLAEYNKWKKNDFIEKACAFLETYPHMFFGVLRSDMIEDFKKYMEDKL